MAGMRLKGKRTYHITALQRGLDLLKLFAASENGLSATAIAKLSHLPVSTVHRFLMNLETSGFLSSDSTGVYHLGIACVTLGHAARGKLDVRRVSLPYLQELNRQTRAYPFSYRRVRALALHRRWQGAARVAAHR